MNLFKECHNDIKAHAAETFPNECCGLIVKGKYIRCNNEASRPDENFEIDTRLVYKYGDDLDCVIHSHTHHRADYKIGPHASVMDMQQQLAMNVPWGIANVINGSTTDIFFWGDSLPIQPLIGRKFYYGAQDCYTLVRDYYRLYKDITLPQIPREPEWWIDGNKNYYTDLYKKHGFKRIDASEVAEGDIIVGQFEAPVANHAGIWLEGGLALHHAYWKLSGKEPIGIYHKNIVYYLRYVGD
jgi:proteasome lid subunit RPN8/RPN11